MQAPPRRDRGRKAKREKPRRAARPSPAKVTPPVIPNAYPRTRLFRLLDAARRDYPATWVAAPAGAGKTTLVVSYIEARKLTCIWYQLDAGDRDPASFFHYLGLAVARAAPRFRQPLPKLTPEYLGAVGIFARNFFRELGRRMRTPFVVVLDNLHELAPDTRFHEILSEGLSELPRGGHAVLISRTDPPEAYARLRLNRQLVQPDWQQLKLTETESAALVRFLRGRARDSGAPDLESLHRRCDGWVAGLLLLLEGARHGKVQARVTAQATSQTLFDYFAAEVFARRPPAARDFLMLTALFPAFTADMAERLTGYPRARALLNELVREHHFTERRAQPADSYQYHPLYLEFLRAHAQATWGDAELARFRHRAAAILERAGDREQALALYLDVGDSSAATRLILSEAPELAGAGRYATLIELIEQLPPTEFQDSPWLLFWRGLCRIMAAPAAARGDFERAYASFEERQDATGLYTTWAAIVESFLIQWTDFKPLDRWIPAFDGLRARYPEFPSIEVEMRAVFAIVGALTNRHLNHPSLPHWLERAEMLLRSAADSARPVWWEMQLFWFFLWMGWMDRAEKAAHELASVGDESAATPLQRLSRRTNLATYHWIMGSPGQAVPLVDEGLKIAGEHGLSFGTYQLLGQAVLASLTCGDTATAATYLEKMAPSLSGCGLADAGFYHFLASMIAAHEGDLARADVHAQTGLRLMRESGQAFGEAMCANTSGVVALLQGDYEAAEARSAAVEKIGQDKDSRAVYFWGRMLNAACLFAQQDHEAAVPVLSEALSLSRALRGHALPWFPHVELARLYGFALQHGIECEHVRGLIRRFGIAPLNDATNLDAWPYPVKVITLGNFGLLVADKPLRFGIKAQKKPLELLKALIALGGRGVREDRLAEILWPQAEADSAAFALTTTVHRLRRLIGEAAIERREGRLALDPRHCWVDVWAAEREMAALEEAGRASSTETVADHVERLLALYRGSFLADQADDPWMLSTRERLRGKFLRAMDLAANVFVWGQRYQQAIQCLEKALEVDALVERLYRALMQAHLAQGHQAEALVTYQRCRKVLAAQLGVEPSADIEALRRQIPIN